MNAISVSCANSCRLWLADGFGPVTEGLAAQVAVALRQQLVCFCLFVAIFLFLCFFNVFVSGPEFCLNLPSPYHLTGPDALHVRCKAVHPGQDCGNVVGTCKGPGMQPHEIWWLHL